MTAVTLATISNSVTLHLRNVLRNNLTDPLSRGTDFIFKSFLEETSVDFPFVIISQDDISSSIETFKDTHSPTVVRINVTVWTSLIQDRDNISDEILRIFKDETSADADTDTLFGNNLKLMSTSMSEEDRFTEERVLRIKEMFLEFQYFGV